MTRVYERITTVTLMGYTVKVWEKSDGFDFGPNHEITVGVRSAIELGPEGLRVTAEGIANVLDTMDRVATYQITDPQGHGVEVFKL